MGIFVGLYVGPVMVGTSVATMIVCTLDGIDEEEGVGVKVGVICAEVGLAIGTVDGFSLGFNDGIIVGLAVLTVDGNSLGSNIGIIVGLAVQLIVGISLGFNDGIVVGLVVGTVDCSRVWRFVGVCVGGSDGFIYPYIILFNFCSNI